MILTIANTKGGVGKSTLAVNIAIARARQGKKVWLVDGDKQGSSQTAILVRSEDGIEPGIACSHYPEGPVLRSQVQLQKDNYDDVIIECGGRDSTAMRAALTITDILIVPSAPGSFEAWAMDANVALIREARSIRDNLICYSLLNKGDTHARSTDNIEMIEMMKDYQDDIPVLDTVIYQRKAFANAAGSGRTVDELKLKGRDKIAVTELDNLMSILYKH
ncbi:plasmid segregation oscillating ATPase ParF [Providencia alcalifaciens]|uniref:Plasmid segregation oscillating ATPase ParF n=1 Tax=Providencia alcalifaciens TaxID=126385 RepID=A0A4R3NJ64_9GAMM|nr:MULTISPECIES: AAA family ATPase [Providencia]MBC5792367.1 AAA family ATPase [Providencia sp. JUb39]TCT27918.1 plasmid segregation oscillating ATPase ParF [Providencia alcalifaciens]